MLQQKSIKPSLQRFAKSGSCRPALASVLVLLFKVVFSADAGGAGGAGDDDACENNETT